MKSIAKAQNDFTIFKFGDSEIRVINKCGEPWFVAKDVCDALALTNSRKALTALDDDEKGVTLSYTLGGEQNLSIVSESGMYTLVLRCRDAVNKGSVPHKFRKWVTAEVLPSIRKHGEYVKGKKTNELSAKEANSLVWLWDYANRSQALFRELYPALKQIQSNYSGRCYDYGHEFSYVIGMARGVLINHTRDVDINEPDGPTNLSAWIRLKNKELPPSVHNY